MGFLLKMPLSRPVSVGIVAVMTNKWVGIALYAAYKIIAPEQPASRPIAVPNTVFFQQMLEVNFGRVLVFLRAILVL